MHAKLQLHFMLQYEKLFRRIRCLSDERVFLVFFKNKCREINIFASLRISADNCGDYATNGKDL